MTQGNGVLSYGPPARSRSRWVWVILAGIATTVITLLGAWAVEHYSKGETTFMGFYLWGIVPVGAFLVGLVAATGYYGVALVTGTRIRGRLLGGILLLTVLAYVGTHYAEFKAMGPMVLRSTGAQLSFPAYYDLETRNMRFVSMSSSKSTSTPVPIFPQHGPPQPTQRGEAPDGALGLWVYGVRGLELGAFSLGTLSLPVILRGRSYCGLCERYHKRHRLAVIPASVRLKVARVRSTVVLDGEHEVARQQAEATMARLTAAMRAGDQAGVAQLIDELRPGSKRAAKTPRRIEIVLDRCPGCGTGKLTSTLCLGTDPNAPTQKNDLWSISVEPAFGDALRPR